MERVKNMSDIAKETLIFLAFFDDEMIKKIPDKVIAKLCEEAADSTHEFYIDINKNFEEQNLSEESKDLISIIYYNYIADEEEKEKIKKQWILNDKCYEKLQNKKYNPENLFKDKK